MVGNDSILRMLSEIESDELHKACLVGVRQKRMQLKSTVCIPSASIQASWL